MSAILESKAVWKAFWGIPLKSGNQTIQKQVQRERVGRLLMVDIDKRQSFVFVEWLQHH